MMLFRRRKLLYVMLCFGLMLALTFMANWMLDAASNIPAGHPMIGGHLREELMMAHHKVLERALDKEKQQWTQQPKGATSVASIPEVTSVATSTDVTKGKTEPAAVATMTTKVTAGTTRLTAVTREHAEVTVSAEAVQKRKHLYHELTNLFGVPLKDCSAYTFTKRSCRDYKEMRFFTKADESYKRRMALASCPGSGNTWLRLALEEATGVFTGSLYNDKSLRCTGFIGEGQKDHKRVLVVKTHRPSGDFDAVIMLIRNPYRAMMSYHTWKVTKSHVSRAVPQLIPSNLFTEYFSKWDQLWSVHVQNTKVPYYIVEYEKLKANFEETMKGVLDFLQFPIDDEKFKCVVSSDYRGYRRPIVKYPNPFTEEQQRQIQGWIAEHKEELAKFNINYTAWVW